MDKFCLYDEGLGDLIDKDEKVIQFTSIKFAKRFRDDNDIRSLHLRQQKWIEYFNKEILSKCFIKVYEK